MPSNDGRGRRQRRRRRAPGNHLRQTEMVNIAIALLGAAQIYLAPVTPQYA